MVETETAFTKARDLVAGGQRVRDACKRANISTSNYYYWMRRNGGSQAVAKKKTPSRFASAATRSTGKRIPQEQPTEEFGYATVIVPHHLVAKVLTLLESNR